jgi:hypothetical protein
LFDVSYPRAITAENRLTELHQHVRSEAGVTVASSFEAMRASHDYQHLNAERDTWLLVHALYKDRLLGTPTADEGLAHEGKEGLHALALSQRLIKRELKEKNRVFRESKVRWTSKARRRALELSFS